MSVSLSVCLFEKKIDSAVYKRHLAFSKASERRKSKSQWSSLFEFIKENHYMCSGEATSIMLKGPIWMLLF